MQITKSGKKIIIKDLKFIEILSLLKIQMPLEIMFAETSGEVNHTLTIRLGYRVLEKVEPKTEIVGAAGTVHSITSIEEIMGDIASYMKDLDVIPFIQIDKDLFNLNQELISYVGKYNEKLINSCSFITYIDTEDVYMIAYPTLKNGDSNKMYFYASNNSMLVFAEEGPRLYTDNAKVTSITDILCK